MLSSKIFSRWHNEIFFFFFPENKIWHFIQIVSMTIYMKCQILFSGKNKHNITNLSCAELAQGVIKVNSISLKLTHQLSLDGNCLELSQTYFPIKKREYAKFQNSVMRDVGFTRQKHAQNHEVGTDRQTGEGKFCSPPPLETSVGDN